MQTNTPEQELDLKQRVEQADKRIKDVLVELDLTIVALPAFQEIEGGRCVAVGITQYRDLKTLHNAPEEPLLENNA